MGPYVQSERLEIYQEAADLLVEHGFAYKCYYSDEDVQHYRKVVEVSFLRPFVAALRGGWD